MTTPTDENLSNLHIDQLRNLGPKSREWLADIGVRTLMDLEERGAVACYQQMRGKGFPATLNLVSRRLLERSFSRVHFESGEASIEFRDFETLKTPLSQENLRHALLASGSIPLVMVGVRSTPGLYGTLFDGGIIDYHFDFTFRRRKGLVLFPHFFDHITPGWFDKPLHWRKPRAADFDDVIMLAPSDSFVASLPGGRVPNRNDFLELETKQRIRQWQTVIDRCRALADDFNDLLEGDRMADACEPYPAT